MKKHIAEELPARKHAPAALASKSSEKSGENKEGGKSPEKRVKQAIYDIRYRARREELPLRQAFSQYMQNSNMSQQEKTLVKQKLFGKGGMQAEDFNIEDLATDNVANALYKVFVKNVKQEEPIVLTYMEKLETAEHRKYKVRVTDNNGRSYVRYATREKISSLRSNPNIKEVEMTGYGEPYEGEKNKGEQTAAAKAGKDYDGDGKVESGAKEYRGAVHNAIQRKKGGTPDGQDTSSVKEAFLGEVSDQDLNPDANQKPIDVMKGKNTVVIAPEVPGSGKNSRASIQMAHYNMSGSPISESQLKFLSFLNEKSVSVNQQQAAGAALSAKRGKTDPSKLKGAAREMYDSMTEKQLRDFAKTTHEGLPEKVDEEKCDCEDQNTDKFNIKDKNPDPRSIPTAINLAKTAARFRGAKNPIVMAASYEPEGEVLDERRAEDRGKQRPERNRALEFIRSRPENEGLMTRSGETIATHKKARGVKKDRTSKVKPESPTNPPSEKLATKKAQQAAAQKASQYMYKPRAGESD